MAQQTTRQVAFRMAEVGRLLGVTEQTVAHWIKNGHLRSFKVGGSRFVPAAELDRLLGARGYDGPA